MSLAKALAVVVVTFAAARPAWATPAFARKEHHACNVCHTAFPELNVIGRAYKLNGYRMSHDMAATGEDLGSGIIVDTIPGLALRIESVLAEMSPHKGEEGVALVPLDAVEVIMAGSSGDHWSYLAEMGAEVDGGFAVKGNAVLTYQFLQAFSAFAGWTPMFSRDAYNTLSESRRIDHIEHAVGDYLGSTGLNMNTESGVVGAFGTVGPVFYMAEVGPGPDAPVSEGEPFDYLGRVGLNLTDNIAVGGFVYDGATASSATIRIGADSQLLTNAGNFKVVSMYDVADAAMLAEVGWNLPAQMQGYALVPMAHVDVTNVGGALGVVPMAGFGIQQSAGRIQIEVSEPLGGTGPAALPTALLIVDAVF